MTPTKHLCEDCCREPNWGADLGRNAQTYNLVLQLIDHRLCGARLQIRHVESLRRGLQHGRGGGAVRLQDVRNLSGKNVGLHVRARMRVRMPRRMHCVSVRV